MMVNVNNFPVYANEYKYIVARLCEDELWFWGAWNDAKQARKAAREVNGFVIPN